jgi:hypothetical protein
MNRSMVSVICCCGLMLGVGCAKMKSTFGMDKSKPMSMDEMKRPGPPVQLRQLDPFIGSWEGTAEMVPDPKSPAATQPVRAFKGAGTHEWTMDGMAMKSTGWHEMPNNQKETFVEYVVWDADARKFRSYYVSDWGEHGNGWMWLDPDGRTFHWNGKSTDAMGNTSSMSGTSTLVDSNTMNWRFTGSGPMGKMQLKGTSNRVRNEGSK